MSATLSHEMSHANNMNSNAYINVGHDPRQRDCNLLVDVHYLSKSPKVVMNSSKKCFKVV
jgi:hypothetical protein